MSWFNVNRPKTVKPGRKERPSGKGGSAFIRAKEPRTLPGFPDAPDDRQAPAREPRPPAQSPPDAPDGNVFR
ncbi:MAG: hypothetical protein WC326_12060 [Candidatus Delongbacteria bacterium]